jgi:hypothetical protein
MIRDASQNGRFDRIKLEERKTTDIMIFGITNKAKREESILLLGGNRVWNLKEKSK